MSEIPKFAFVGPVNPGKTSVLATLLEKDELRISPVPGETTDCQRFEVRIDDQSFIEFFDTPGFQNAENALTKLKEMGTAQGDPLDLFRSFIAKFGHDPDFAAECRLFGPLIAGAGIVYVVDASQKIWPIDEAQMEILRLTGRPRLGLINWTQEPTYKALWAARLNMHFNLVREFNAHTATYLNRIDLLQSLAEIHWEWRPLLQRAVEVFKEDWRKRTRDCAEIISELLIESISYQATANYDDRTEETTAKRELVAKYKHNLRKMENRAHKQMVRIFKHHKVSIDEASVPLFDEDLFSEKTWQLLGLNQKQLVVAATLSGAGIGAAVDAATLGHSFGLGAGIGATIGAGSALLGGKNLAKVEVKFPGRLGAWMGRRPLGGQQMVVGPCTQINFPWILLDRALTVYYTVLHRAHARQDQQTINPAQLIKDLAAEKVLCQTWNDPVRKECEQIFSLLRRKKSKPEHRQKLRNLIYQQLIA